MEEVEEFEIFDSMEQDEAKIAKKKKKKIRRNLNRNERTRKKIELKILWYHIKCKIEYAVDEWKIEVMKNTMNRVCEHRDYTLVELLGFRIKKIKDL